MFYSAFESEMPLKCENIHTHVNIHIWGIIFLNEAIHRYYLTYPNYNSPFQKKGFKIFILLSFYILLQQKPLQCKKFSSYSLTFRRTFNFCSKVDFAPILSPKT